MPTDDPLDALEKRDKEILAAFVQEFRRPEDVRVFIMETKQRARDYDRLMWLFKGARLIAVWVAALGAGWAVFKGWLSEFPGQK